MPKLIFRHTGRTRHRFVTASLLFSVPAWRTRLSQIVAAGNKLAGLTAIALTLALSAQGCQNSFTPKPKCPAGWHVEHAPSHQGHVWDCVANDGSGRVPEGPVPAW